MLKRISLSSVFAVIAITAQLLGTRALAAAKLPLVTGVELQPLAAQVQRLIEAMDLLGEPFSDADKKALQSAMREADAEKATARIQEILDPHCLVGVNINPEMRVKVAAGEAKPELVEQGWRQFLVKVQNESGTTSELRAVSPNAESVHDSPWKKSKSDEFYRKRNDNSPLRPNAELWLDLDLFNRQPMKKELSGLKLEYAIAQLYSRDAGKREAKLSFNVGQGTQDLGFRSELDVLFHCQPAADITFRVKDEHGQPTTASFLIRDHGGRVYPSQAKRLAPDFAFHPQVYRADGESVKLPQGEYAIEYTRGPEYLTKTEKVSLDGQPKTLSFKLERWIDPTKLGYWSGDHHIHAAGCAHYTKPTEGVHAPDMMRHCLGEDLKVGCCLFTAGTSVPMGS